MNIEGALNDLLRHMEWADARMWTTVLSSPTACADTALRDRLYHIHVTQHAFLQVWRGPAREAAPTGFEDSPSLARWARVYYAEALAYAAELNGEKLAHLVPDSLIKGAQARLGPGASTPSIGDTVLQVLMHSTYHRGQVSTRLRELGCEPVLTEYFVWVWLGKPGPEWPPAAS